MPLDIAKCPWAARLSPVYHHWIKEPLDKGRRVWIVSKWDFSVEKFSLCSRFVTRANIVSSGNQVKMMTYRNSSWLSFWFLCKLHESSFHWLCMVLLIKMLVVPHFAQLAHRWREAVTVTVCTLSGVAAWLPHPLPPCVVMRSCLLSPSLAQRCLTSTRIPTPPTWDSSFPTGWPVSSYNNVIWNFTFFSSNFHKEF